MSKGVFIFSVVVLILMVVAVNIAIPFAIMFVANSLFGYKLSFWVVAIAWWLFTVIVNMFRGKK